MSERYEMDRRECRHAAAVRGNHRINLAISLAAFAGAAWLLWLLVREPVIAWFTIN